VSAPTLPTGHDEYEALAVAWAIDALEPADQAIFETHLVGCEDCARTVIATLDVAVELAYGVPDVAPPPRLRQRVLGAATPPTRHGGPTQSTQSFQPASPAAAVPPVQRSRPVQSTPPAQSSPPGRMEPRDRRAAGSSDGSGGRPPRGAGPGRSAQAGRRRRRWVYALAAAVLISGSAVTTWEVTRPAAVADRVAALSAGSGTVATIVAHQHGADVVTDALPANAGRGTAYYLWGVPARGAGTPQVVGTFVVTADGLHSYPVRLIHPLDTYPVLAVSEERAGSMPATPSTVLGKGTLSR
jgi:anti-sigma-K factor RskA